MKTSVMYLMLFMLACAVNARPSSFVDTSIQHYGTTPLPTVALCRPSGGGEGTSGGEGVDAVGDALHQVAQGLLRVEEVLRLLGNRMQKLEASIERALGAARPGMTTLIVPLERHSFPVEPSVISLTSTAPSTSPTLPTLPTLPTSISSSSAPTSPSTFSPTTFPSTSLWPPTVSALGATATGGTKAKHTQWGDADAKKQEREKWEMKLRIQEFKENLDRGFRDYSSPGETFRRATESGTYYNVRHLLDSGADVNYTSRDGQDMLKTAIQRNEQNADIVKLLLERGADVNSVDLHGLSPLHLAARYDLSGKIVTLLIGAGAVVDARDGGGATPLHRAAHFYNLAGVRVLLAAGANKSLRGWDGWCRSKTPFDVTKADNIRDLLRP